MQSAGLMAVHQKKLDRYSLLAALAERHVLDGLRAVAPVIFAGGCLHPRQVLSWDSARAGVAGLKVSGSLCCWKGTETTVRSSRTVTPPFVASSTPPSSFPLARASLTCSSLGACPLRARTAATHAGSALVPDRRQLHPAAGLCRGRPRSRLVPVLKRGLILLVTPAHISEALP